MLKRAKLRFQDMRTIAKLIPGADKAANNMGEEEAGAEHFLLSALRLPDGTASNVFDRLQIDADQFQQAIKKQYSDSLSTLGIDVSMMSTDAEPLTSERIFKTSKPSGQAVMKALYELKKSDKDRPILSVHVLAVIARMEYGVVARTLKAMEIDRDCLIQAVDEEIRTFY